MLRSLRPLGLAGPRKFILFIWVIVGLAAAPGCGSYQTSNNTLPAASQTPEQTGEGGSRQAATPSASNTEPKPSQTPTRFDEPDANAAADIIRQYYVAINAREYKKAYELWSGSGETSKKTFEQFRDGFAQTRSTSVEIGKPSDIEGAAGSRYITFPVTVHATTKDGKEQNFKGEYVLRRSVVDGATAEQRAWRIYSAKINAS